MTQKIEQLLASTKKASADLSIMDLAYQSLVEGGSLSLTVGGIQVEFQPGNGPDEALRNWIIEGIGHQVERLEQEYGEGRKTLDALEALV